MYSVVPTVYGVLCIVYSVQYMGTVCSVVCIENGVPCIVLRVQFMGFCL